MTVWLEILFGLFGAGVGLLSGWLAVVLERVEKLEAEEQEERVEYEKEVAERKAAAEEKGEEVPADPPWEAESYGWTWLEWGLSPVLGAFSFALFTGHDGLTASLPFHLLWMAVFVHIIAFDLKHRLILNKISYPATVLAVALSPLTPGLGIVRAVSGLLVIAAFWWIASIVTRGGIGLGDAKLGGFIGAITGISFDAFDRLQAVYATIDGIFIAGAVFLIVVVIRVRRLKDALPYAPYLCAGAALVLYNGF